MARSLGTKIVGILSLFALAGLAFSVRGGLGVDGTAIVEASATWEVASDGAGRYRWSLADGRHPLGRGLRTEQVVGFGREDHVDLVLGPDIAGGAMVTQGQTVATVHSTVLEQAIRSLSAQRDALSAQRALLAAGGRPEEVAEALRRVEVAASARDAAEADVSRLDALRATGAVGSVEAQVAQQLLQLREREHALASAGVAVVRSSARPEALAALDAQVVAAEAEIEQARGRLDAGTLTSPIDGLLEIGGPGVMLRVYDLDEVYVRFAVEQGHRDAISVDDVVTFRLPEGGAGPWTGALVEISESVTWVGARPMFAATARIENPDLALRTGMIGAVRVRPKADQGPLLTRLTSWLGP